MTSKDILDAIEERWIHRFSKRYILLRELRVGTGFDHAQRIDAFLLDAYPSGGMHRTAFEVKISRADFLREIKQPNKRRPAMRYSNCFYFATPKGLLKPGEIPVACGLVEISLRNPEANDWRNSRFNYDITVPAPHRDVPGPTWTFMAAAIRCLNAGRVVVSDELESTETERVA